MNATLSALEGILQQMDARYQKEGGFLKFSGTSAALGVSYPISCGEGPPGWIRTKIWFPPGEKFILDVHDFCKQATRRNATVELGYHSDTRQCYGQAYLQLEYLWLDLDLMIEACDRSYPLVVQVGREGRWSPQLIEFSYGRPPENKSIH